MLTSHALKLGVAKLGVALDEVLALLLQYSHRDTENIL